MTEPRCPFCNIAAEEVLTEVKHAFLIQDAYPLASGHCLIVPRRHICSVFDATDAETEDLWNLVKLGKQIISSEKRPIGFNVGFNDGTGAGQTILHAHIHIIPRYTGDLSDPRGGIRWILPETANYWNRD